MCQLFVTRQLFNFGRWWIGLSVEEFFMWLIFLI